MNTDLLNMIRTYRNGDEEVASRLFSKYISEKAAKMLNEDHQNYMSLDKMEKYISDLHSKVNDKAAFLAKLASYSTLDEVSERDFRKCAADIKTKGKDFMDEVIHELEALVNQSFTPVDDVREAANMLSRPIPGVSDNDHVKVPNVYATKKVSKKSKKLPKLKKGIRGIGYAPGAWHGDHASDGGASGLGDVGGGGDGGGAG